MKKCPYCAEEIQEDAIKCKHCGEWLKKENKSTENISLEPSSYKQRPSTNKTETTSHSKGTYGPEAFGIFFLILGVIFFIYTANNLPTSTSNAFKFGSFLPSLFIFNLGAALLYRSIRVGIGTILLAFGLTAFVGSATMVPANASYSFIFGNLIPSSFFIVLGIVILVWKKKKK